MPKFLLAILLLSHMALACVPEPDILIVYPDKVDGVVSRLPLNDYPLSSYLQSHFCKYPFKMLNTANLRGYTAYWSLKKSRLYLDSVFIKRGGMLQGVHLDWLFGKNAKEPVFADWVDGVLLAGHDDFFDSKRDSLIQFAYQFNHGRLVEFSEYRGKTENAQKPKKYVHMAEMRKGKRNRRVKHRDLCPEVLLQDDAQKNLDITRNNALARRKAMYRAGLLKIENIAKEDSAYGEFLKIFLVQNAYFKQKNLIHFLLKPLKKSPVNEVTLHFSLEGNRVGFEKVNLNFSKAILILNKFAWLKKWLAQSSKHSAILKMGNMESGLSIESLLSGINRLWQLAKFPGKAEAQVEFFNDGEKVASVFFGSEFDAAVVTEYKPSELGRSNRLFHLLENKEISCCSLLGREFEFATITINGDVQMLRLYDSKSAFFDKD